MSIPKTLKVILHGNYDVSDVVRAELSRQALETELRRELMKDAKNAGLYNVQVIFQEGLE